MKTAMSNLAWAGLPPSPHYQLLADQGVAGLEVAPTVLFGEEVDIRDPGELIGFHRQMLSEFGLSVVGLQSLYYGHPEFQFADGPVAGASLVAHSERLVDLCCTLGARYLLIGAPANRHLQGLAPADAEKRAAETLHRIGAYAAERRVWFSVEALDAAYGCQLGCTLIDIARLLDMADSAGVRPHLDTGTTDPAADNPFGAADFGSAQVSPRADVEIVADPDQHRWARYLDEAQAPEWLSLELPPPTKHSTEGNAARIADGLRQMREVFSCR